MTETPMQSRRAFLGTLAAGLGAAAAVGSLRRVPAVRLRVWDARGRVIHDSTEPGEDLSLDALRGRDPVLSRLKPVVNFGGLEITRTTIGGGAVMTEKERDAGLPRKGDMFVCEACGMEIVVIASCGWVPGDDPPVFKCCGGDMVKDEGD